MQGVRRADPRLGEVTCVIGLGLIGMMAVQIVAAAGARVVGIDIDPERVEKARVRGHAHYHVGLRVRLRRGRCGDWISSVHGNQ